MEQKGNGRPPQFDEKSASFSEPGRSQIRSDRPWHRTARSPTGPRTGAIRAGSSKEGKPSGRRPVASPVLDRLLRSMARSDRAPDRAARSATGLCACDIRAPSSKVRSLPGQDPVPAPVGNRPARSVARSDRAVDRPVRRQIRLTGFLEESADVASDQRPYFEEHYK
jgi:hypothetical protein